MTKTNLWKTLTSHQLDSRCSVCLNTKQCLAFNYDKLEYWICKECFLEGEKDD